MWSCLSIVHWRSVRPKVRLLSPTCHMKPRNCLIRNVLASPSAMGIHWEWIFFAVLSIHPHFTGAGRGYMKLWSNHLCTSTQYSSKEVFLSCCKNSGSVCIYHFKLLSAELPNTENSLIQEALHHTHFYWNQDQLWDKLTVQQQSKLFSNKPFIAL